MVTFYEIPDKSGQMVRVVKTADIQPCKENSEIYPEDKDKTYELAEKMVQEYNTTGLPNREEIEVDKETGNVFAGCRRTIVGKGDKYFDRVTETWKYYEFEYLRARKSTKRYKQMNKASIIWYLQHINLDGKRDENSYETILSVYLGLEAAWLKCYPNKKSFRHTSEGQQFIRDRGINGKILSQLLTINDTRSDLIKSLDLGEISLGKAEKQAKDVSKPKDAKDPERFDFHNHIVENPSFKDKLAISIIEAKDQFMNITISGKKLINHDQFGFEYPQISAVYSNIINTAAAFHYVEVDSDLQTGRKKMDAYGDSRPDIQFLSISKDGFQGERLEVKVASWNSQASSIKFYGGPGVKSCYDHEYLLCVHSDGGNQMFLMLATLSPNDWVSSGGKFVLTLGTWFNNHFNKPINKPNKDTDKLDYTFLMGDIRPVGNQTKTPYINWYRK